MRSTGTRAIFAHFEPAGYFVRFPFWRVDAVDPITSTGKRQPSLETRFPEALRSVDTAFEERKSLNDGSRLLAERS